MKHQLRKSISLRAGAYAELASLAAAEGRSLAAVVEGLVHNAYRAHVPDLPAIDFHAERELVRERRLQAEQDRQDELLTAAAPFFSGLVML